MMESSTLARLGIFLGVFAVLATAEIFLPRRKLLTSKSRRWSTNLTIVALNPLAVTVIFPVFPVGLALLASEKNWGLLNQLTLPYTVEILIGVIALDFVVYTQHVLHHAIPALWRLHMVHHADLDFDMTTGLRFHPIEIVISMAIKLSAVAALGISAPAVLIFEVALNTTAMFNHSNINIAPQVDRILRLLVVTPDMHRVHHSVIISETNSNYGFNLPWWDRLLGTYKDQPDKGHTEMVIGLSRYRDPHKLSLLRLLILPFSGNTGRVPTNRG
jgi:sterol desaturase/sphingolipid hydroxylase (fatty acid hydroxylase superfamily)